MVSFCDWLSGLRAQSPKTSIRKSGHKRQDQPLPTVGEVLEQRVLLSAATVTQFTGADIGEGLDLDGTFKYAIDIGVPSANTVTTVRDARFTSEATLGVSVNAQSRIASFVAPAYGSDLNDRNLATVMSSIAHNAPNGNMQINLAGVSPGVTYKLQLLFADSSTVRGFDIKVEGALIQDEFNPSIVQGANQQSSNGVVVTYEFVATDNTVNIELNGSTANFADKNAIINALTLEALPPMGTVSVSTFTGGDIGEGLDLDGSFRYAIDYGAPVVNSLAPPVSIRDANFVVETNKGQFLPTTTTNGRDLITNYIAPSYGSTQNDNRLSNVMASIVHNPDGAILRIDLPSVISGVKYKLQLMFADASSTRGFDVRVEGNLVKDEFNPSAVHGAGQQNSKGVVLTYEFVATDETVNIELNGPAANFADKNPILNALTLEDLRPTVTFGSLVNPTEGFGYRSTIAGLGGAVDTTEPSLSIDGSFSKSLGIVESGQFTMESWLYPKPGISTGVVWNFGGQFDGYQLFRVNDTGLRLVLSRAGVALPGTDIDVTANNVLNADAWNHLAATFDGEFLRLFVNGVEVITAPDTVPDYANVSLVNIAYSRFRSTDPLEPQTGAGMIDEVRVWNIARTQAEVQESALLKLTGSEPGLAAYWDFDHPGAVDPTNGKTYTELDSTGSGNFLNVNSGTRAENAAPQIGYVDVLLNQPVTSPLGLFVTYSVSTNSANNNVDYYSSRFRTVSNDPATERNGIIIPQGESSGRIYFMARSDAIYDPSETITVAATPFSFLGATSLPDYLIGSGASATATVTITDSGAYRPGISLTDTTGRPVTTTSPLYIDPLENRAKFYVQLTSQPASAVSIHVQTPSAGGTFLLPMTFTTDNWNVPQLVDMPAAPAVGNITINDQRLNGVTYFGPALSFPYTKIAPAGGLVQEGSSNDLAPVKPTVTLGAAQSVNEDEDIPANVQVLLNAAAPAGGLDVAYTILAGSTAVSGVHYKPLTGIVHIEEGLLSAELPVFPIDDQTDQGSDLSLTVVLAADSKYLVGTTSRATVTIVNDDHARISVSNPSFSDVAAPKAQSSLPVTQTVTNYSSTYATLTTVEPTPPTLLTTEPNNTVSTAYQLDTVYDEVSVLNQVISNSTDVDLYRFKLVTAESRPAQLQVNFQFDATHNLRIDLLNAATGAVLKTGANAGSVQYLDLKSLADGEYVVQVRAENSSVISTPYTLRFRSLTNPAEVEGNDTAATATYLGTVQNGERYTDLSINTSTDQDYYRFTLNTAAGRPDSVSILGQFDDGNIIFEMVGEPRTSALVAPYLGQSVKQISLFGLPDGDYIIRARGTQGSMNKYDLAFGSLMPRQNQTSSNQVALKLDTRPTANVTLNLTQTGLSEGRLGITSLLFTPDNWDKYQLVSISPLDDGTADGDKTYTITATGTSADPKYQNKILTFNITNIDRGTFVSPDYVDTYAQYDDPHAPLVTIQSIPRSGQGEGQTIDAFKVLLLKPLTTDLTIGLDYDRGTAIYGVDFTIDTGNADPRTVTIKAGTTSKIIRATLINDLVDESFDDVAETLRATIVDTKDIIVPTVADPGFTATFNLADNNSAGFVTIGPGGFSQFQIASTTENQAGGAAEHTIKLTSKPTAPVTVFVGSSDPSEGLIQTSLTSTPQSQVSLLFTPDNWNVPQTFYVKGVDDRIDDGNIPYKIVVSSTSDDDVYRRLVPVNYDASNGDDDTAGITVTSPQGTVSGRANVFSVFLNTQPLGEVRVTLTPQNEQIYLNSSRPGDPLTLTFNADNWNVPQLVQAAALDDGTVEYFHTSQINFSVSTGRLIDGPTVADVTDSTRAFDLGDVTGGVTWSNLTLPLKPTATQPPYVNPIWLSLDFPARPNAAGELNGVFQALNQIRVLTVGDNQTDLPTIEVYSADGRTLVASGVKTAAVRDANGYITAAAFTTLSLAKVPAAGTYMLKLSPPSGGGLGPNTQFELRIEDSDRAYESVTPAPVKISIKDNDLPTAEIIAGPTASEIFAEPSYFAVRLNAPAPTNTGETGINVYFKVTGGRASVGTATSTLHDYTINADQFDVATGLGMIRVAPGDYQANIGIVPIDDKLVEDLQVTLNQFNATTNEIQITAKRNDIDASTPYDPSYTLTAGTVIKGRLANGTEIELVVRTTTPLLLNAGQTDYVGNVAVTLSARDSTLAADSIKNGVSATGRIKSEDVEITLISGVGYVLPLAPNKQGADPAVVANQDLARTIARMKIFDDDVPGVQIIETPEHSTVEEGNTTTFQVSLTAEPLEPVTVMLTPSGGLEFVNPAESGTGTTNIVTYALGTPDLPTGVDLTYVSLHETDQGFTAVFDARLNRVTYGAVAKTSTLTLSGNNGGGTDSIEFEIPGSTELDAAGNPQRGTWETVQRIIVTNLKQNSNGTFSLTVNLDGTAKTITLTPNTATPKSVTTTTLKFDSSTWFLPQTVTIRALQNSLAEPGEWHMERVAYAVTSTDGNWNELAVPAQEVHVQDTLLDTGELLNGLGTGLNMLQDGLLGLELPLLGTVGELPVLNTLFDQFEQPLEESLAGQDEVSVTKFQALAESALQPLITAGILDNVSVVPSADATEVRVDLHLDKTIVIGSLDLSSDLGLEALGLRFATTGKATAIIEFSLDIGFGWNQQFGFFIDTATTGMHMGAKLALEGNGAKPENPNNLFTGQGSLGFLQLDFTDDPNNSTELGITFDVDITDLDNLGTVQFFDINGDGLLGEAPFSFQVGKDANNDGRLDLDANGNPIRRATTVTEPWTNISVNGTADAFPAATQGNGANWNTVGASYNQFTEATSIRNEGIYRTKTKGNQTLVYLDLNRDGTLNIGRRNADPFTTNWSSLTTAEKNSSEIWLITSSPQNVNDWKILTTGAGAATAYFIDVNQNNVAESGEAISTTLRTKLDKDNSRVLEGDDIQDGEGQFVQGTSTAYYDTNSNKKLDANEPFISYGFEDFQLSTEVFVEDASGKEFLDLNGDGIFNSGELQLRSVGATDTVYLDFNGDGILSPQELSILKSSESFTIMQSKVDAVTSTIQLGTVTYIVRTVDGARFIDLDNNGELTLDDEDRPLEPHAVQRTSLNFTDLSRLVLKIHAANAQVFNNIKTTIDKLKNNQPLNLGEQQEVATAFNKLVSSGKVIAQANDGDRLTLEELLAFKQSIKSNNATAKGQIKSAAAELFTYQFQGAVNLGLTTRTSIGGSTDFPSFQLDLAVNVPLFNFGNSEEANDEGMTVQFKNVAMDLGSFLGSYMKPILATANDLLEPIKPLIAALNADTKIFGQIGLAGAFEFDGKPGISLLEVARRITPNPAEKAKIETAIKFANQLNKLVGAVETLSKNLSTDQFLIEFGDFTLNDLRAASEDPANSASRAVNSTRADGTATTTQTVPTTSAAAIEQQAQNSSRFKNAFNALKQLDGLKFDLFNPSTIFALITGEDNVRLITYDIPDIEFQFALDKSFKIWGPLAGKLEGGFNVKSDLSMGYDTHGFQEWAAADYAVDKSYLVFDGLFVDDWNTGGVDKDELFVSAFVGAGLGLDVGIANGFVKGGVQGIIGLDFVDAGERTGTSDGRIRGSDIIEALSTNPAELFDLNGKISAYLAAEVSVNLFFFKSKVYDKRLATFDLATFKLSAGSFSGTGYSGRVQTGTTAGATVWLDVNNNEVFDADEPFAITDFEGNYQLIVPDEIDFSSAPIRVEGGIDVSTGLEATDVVTIPPGQGGNATALTSLEEALIGIAVDTSTIDFNGDHVVDEADLVYFYETLENDPQNTILDINQDESVDEDDFLELERLYLIALRDGKLTVAQAEKLIQAAFGIDPSVDLSTFLHFDEARAGNPVATAVLVGENNVNTLVTQIDAILAGAAGVSRDNHQLSGTFSEATFQAIARQILRGQFDPTDRDQLRAIVLDALAYSENWIVNHGLYVNFDRQRIELNLDVIVEILHASMVNQRALAASADGSTELVEFITESKVWLHGKVSTDLHQLAMGNLSGEELADDQRTDPEILESIKSILLPPLVSDIHDVYLDEDADPFSVPFTVRSDSHHEGLISIIATSNNLELLSEEGLSVTQGLNPGEYILTIHPLSNADGVAQVTLHVVDSAGAVSDQEFLVTVMGVDDAPVATADRALVVAGMKTTIDPLVNDIDPEGDFLQLALATVPSSGQVTVNPDHTVTYQADATSTGRQSFIYHVGDGNGGMVSSVVTIEILAPLTVNSPVVTFDAETAENSGTLATGSDIIATLSASIGAVVDQGNGTWSWALPATEEVIASQHVTITATYNGIVQDSVTFVIRAGLGILTPETIAMPENTLIVSKIAAASSLPQENGLKYSVTGGADQSAFRISKRKGVLRFTRKPDFEVPRDVGADNSYVVQVSVSNGSATVTKEFTVNVTNANDRRAERRRIKNVSANRKRPPFSQRSEIGSRFHWNETTRGVQHDIQFAQANCSESLDAVFAGTIDLDGNRDGEVRN